MAIAFGARPHLVRTPCDTSPKSPPYDTTSIKEFLTVRFDLEPLPGVRENMGDLTAALNLP
jgi:hypothetical protein